MCKKIDNRIRQLIENGVAERHRSMFVIVGDRGRDQVVNLHYMLSKATVAQRPSVLWCYKKELGFSSHRQKRMKQIKKAIQRGLIDADKDDPFELFISSTTIRYTYYKETHKVLGNTFGMCVLQDFEALTPNILARTIETVEGGGVIVLLLRTMSSLRQLYTMAMDVHARYRTEAHQDVVARFNERFLLSLGDLQSCMVLDDELNVLPLSASPAIQPKPRSESSKTESPELIELKKSLEDSQPVGSLIKAARTIDQAKAILTFVEAISEKTLRTTVSLTAGRGRGKSAAMGVAIAGAVAFGYSNIFVTSPSPENLKTLFEFIFKGFDLLGYEEHTDYDIIQSTNPEFNKAVVRVNIFRSHHQTIQYIQPQDSHVLGQAELVVIDEAAAIPLPLVKALLGPYLVFLTSTINGYEGTGRSLSLKLLQQLREQSAAARADASSTAATSSSASITGRTLREIKLEEPIRYAPGDHVEKWLNTLLCLDATTVPRSLTGCPHPDECNLFYVERDTLFSYHPAAESFLQRLVALYVASHYKNTPNDLQLLSDAPAHNLFVLLAPVAGLPAGQLPEILAVVQVALEGEISKESVLSSLARGQRASGDLIPWTISQQYQDNDFASLSGGRIVRIATHPDYQKMGYGSRALSLLRDYYNGKMMSVAEPKSAKKKKASRENVDEQTESTLQTEAIQPRKNLPPLLLDLAERAPERLHYLGVSYGITQQLHKFWKNCGYIPVYLRQTSNDLTGEYTCIMLNKLDRVDATAVMDATWVQQYWFDFERRFLQLLSFQFRKFSPILALEIMSNSAGREGAVSQQPGTLTPAELHQSFSSYDLRRLDAYSRNLVDYHVILDLIPALSSHYFLRRMPRGGDMSDMDVDDDSTRKRRNGSLPSVNLSAVQSAVMVGMGLQRKTLEDLESELSLPVSQLLALFNKSVRKMSQFYAALQEAEAGEELKAEENASRDAREAVAPSVRKEKRRKVDAEDEEAWAPLEETLEQDLGDMDNETKKKLREQQKELLQSMDLSQYAIGGDDAAWSDAINRTKGKNVNSISVQNPNNNRLQKASKRAAEEVAALEAEVEKQQKSKQKTLKRHR